MNLADICNKLVKNSENIHQFLRHSKESEEIWKELTKCSYNYLKNEEKDLGFISDKSSLKKLYIKGVDIEQIWQQIELQNNSLLVASDLDSDTVSDNNLCYLVAKLSSSVIQDINDEEINSDNNTDEGVETGSGDEDELIEEEEEENSDLDDLGDDELDVDGEADLEKEEQIDFDADTFADLAQEGEDTTDSENDIDDEEQAASDDNEKILDDEQNNESTENKKFKSSLIDSKFLNLRESEWIADNDIIGKDDPDHIDFMEDIQSGESDDEIMYDQFFDPPPSEDRLEIEDKLNNQLDFEEEKSIEESAESEPKEDDTKQGPIDVQTKSKFDLELEREDSLKERLVDENYILEKPWAQKGEATKEQRPENSALEEPLEYNIAVSEKKFSMQKRYYQPSLAISMPSLASSPINKALSKTCDQNLQNKPSNRSSDSETKYKMNEIKKSNSKNSYLDGSSKTTPKDKPKIRSTPKKADSKEIKHTVETSKNTNNNSNYASPKSIKNVTMDKQKKDATNINKKNDALGTILQNSSFPAKSKPSEIEKNSNDKNVVTEGNDEALPSHNSFNNDISEKKEPNNSGLYEQEKAKRAPKTTIEEVLEQSLSVEEEQMINKNESTFLDEIKKDSLTDKEIEMVTDYLSTDLEEQVKAFSDLDEDEENELMGLTEDYEATDQFNCETPVDAFYNYDPKYDKLASMSWADQMDAIEDMEAVRPPGRVLHIHEKLSSPSRKLPISEKFRRHKEKLAKAQELRGKIIQAKTEKLKDWFKKIDEVNNDKERILMQKRDQFERKMERAEEKRRSHLQEIINKAHDEDNKAKEIAFINGLEAQNKLHDIMQQHQSHESRLADRAEERSRRQEEKAAKEAAAQERRKALEAERQARMAELCEKRKRKFEKITQKQAERREELLEQAREKARDREERLSALQQAQLAKESELVKKIQQKLEETTRRHEENIEQIRQRALESSIMKFSKGCDDAPKLLRYETKKICTLCNSLIASEVYLLSHLRGKHHQEALKELHKSDVSVEESQTYNIKFIVDAPSNIDDPQLTRDKERQKALRKRCKKIRIRLVSKGKEFLDSYQPPNCKETPAKARISKALLHIGKVLSGQGLGPWPTADVSTLDRHLLELLRLLEPTNQDEQTTFASLNGIKRLFAILSLITMSDEEERPCILPSKSLTHCAKVILSACRHFVHSCRLVLCSNMAGDTVDFIMRRFNQISTEVIENGSLASLPSDSTAAALMELLAEVLKVLSEPKSKSIDGQEGCEQRLRDVVSYCISMGVADKISWYFNHIQDPVDNVPSSGQVILAAMNLLSTLARTVIGRSTINDPTQLIGTFHVTEACGVVSLMYGLLLYEGGRSPSPPPEGYLSPSTLAISEAGTTLLLNLAAVDLSMFQTVLGSEGISLEFRHISSFLLWYCSHWPREELLHNIISLVGFFTVNNKENQMIIQSGETPSVLQQLCSLPWQYFSEPKLTRILFPTLLSCCLHNDDNKNILQQDMSFQVLEDFLKNKEAQDHALMQIIQITRESSG